MELRKQKVDLPVSSYGTVSSYRNALQVVLLKYWIELLWALEHDRLRRERVFRNRLNPLAVNDAHFLSVIWDYVGLSLSSVSRIIIAVISAIFNLAQMDTKMPHTRHEIQKIKQDFFAIKGFPSVLGATDCTHIPIKPPRQEHLYLNRKRVHSLNVQVVSDALMKIMSFSAKFSGVFMILTSGMIVLCVDTSLNNRDSGYPLETCLMTPAERCYNSNYACTRAVIEQCFGVLKSRLRSLHKSGGLLSGPPMHCGEQLFGPPLHYEFLAPHRGYLLVSPACEILLHAV
ncbi:putative nuclease HARBI1 [Penaeus japonicus]|uniref:putative nuclease HARBI1 n=1 Tax=Penaeus japonicus TaxID=27405 RepID=UPI001C70D12F|nr:putative nuclease HARBI1 [Penaeus japonicus]